MAVGDQAIEAGLQVVPDTGEEGRVRWGAREINRTRDYIAQVMSLIPSGKEAARQAAGITAGTGNPTGGNDGDVYFKVL